MEKNSKTYKTELREVIDFAYFLRKLLKGGN